jgi:hypothetical protein
MVSKVSSWHDIHDHVKEVRVLEGADDIYYVPRVIKITENLE